MVSIIDLRNAAQEIFLIIINVEISLLLHIFIDTVMHFFSGFFDE